MAREYDNQDVYIDVTGEEKTFTYRDNLTVAEMINFVDKTTNLIVTDTYEYIIRDMMFDYMVIRMFTDIDCSEIDECETANTSFEMIRDLVYGTIVADVVKSEIAPGLLDELNKAIDYTVEVRTGVRINRVENALIDLISMITEKLSSYDVDAMSGAAKVFSGLQGGDFNVNSLLEAYAKSDVFKKQQQLALNASEERMQRVNAIKESIEG